ncbi:MAG TPA: sodium-dependent transporter [Phycisphaerae bacterium]|nr:sodium-dependent transporter [Phycisphaerae bacterium]HNU46985.1 sodium-dependent transporter [Phycisphaerae bacterium]
MARQKEQWGTRLGVILAVAGSAVGLGNFLRFPGNAAQNGGGAFMIPYFCALIFLGIPICWAEWSMGKYGGRYGYNSYPAIFGLLGRRTGWRYAGVLGLLIPIIIYMYYVLIESWCLGYAWMYLTGQVNLGSDPSRYIETSQQLFDGFVGKEQDGLMMHGTLHTSVVFWMLAFAVNFVIIFRGVSKGIERFCTVAMPLLLVFALIILVRVLTLGTPDPAKPDQNVVSGLGFMWNPKPRTGTGSWLTALADPQVWLASASQIFFTLSVGFGIIANYASYLKPKDDVVLSGLTASATNEFCEVCLGGLITIPAAFVFLGPAVGASLDSTFSLGFQTLPVVFGYMPAGALFGGIWFFMLFLAAITSSLSMLQPAIAFLEEGLNVGRRASCALLGLITGAGSLFVIYFSYKLVALDTMDFWVGSVLVYCLALVEVVLFAWVFGARRGYDVAAEGAAMPMPRLFIFVIKYISPLYLLIVFFFWCVQKLPENAQRFKESVPLLTLLVIVATAVFLAIAVRIAGRRWRREGVDAPAEHGFRSVAETKP